ncbi:integrase [Sinorhizobium fredii]|uniref:Integrase family protein n=1 Tax=Sinorhizobium fredii (strain USDA 257) TaxID=1185652 RepID=I3X8G1_SINF2|nr:tyrosine-type recombinase/integrase [Sinorhizobium fredii]AFL52167.1 integrase family protein [Sinorhizobium fredii USDA 257]
MATHPDYPGASSRMHRGREVWRYRGKGRSAKEFGLPGQPGDECFEVAYQRATTETKTEVVEMPRGIVPKSFAHAQRLMLKQAWFTSLVESTRNEALRDQDEFMKAHVDDEHELRWKDVLVENARVRDLRRFLNNVDAKSKTKAKHLLTGVRKLVRVALDEEWVEIDPTHVLKYEAPQTDGFLWWPPEVREKFKAHFPLGTRARTAFVLAYGLGNRRSDVATVRWDQIVKREIKMADGSLVTVEGFHFRQMKNRSVNGGREVFLVITDDVREALDALDGPREGTILKNAYGRPYTIAGLGNRMQKWVKQAGIPEGYTLHGLRKALATDLAENGATESQMQHSLGHATPQEVRVYTRKMNEAAAATKALLDLEAARKKARQPKLVVVK